MALVRFNSNRSIDGIQRRAGDEDDVENWRPIVDSGAASLVEEEEPPAAAPPSPPAPPATPEAIIAAGLADGSITP